MAVMALHDNFKGAILMALAMAGFTINDAMVRLVAPDMNTGQIMFVRGAMTAALIAAVAWKMDARRPLRLFLDPWLGLRTAAEIVASVTYVAALGMLPLSNAAAILQALPLAVTMGAALFLGEPVGWRRWIAILVGFGGVLVIIRPGAEGFTAASLLVVASVVAAAIRDIATRKIDRDIPSLLVSAVSASVVALAGAVLIVPFGGWTTPPAADFGALAIAAAALFTGYQTLIMAMRTGEVSFIAPFRYTGLLWSIALGILLLSEFPDAWMLAGSLIVVAAGIYTFHRENRRHRALLAASAESTVS
jgi:drug/metabolite transporter (DMT)-like permease